MWGWEKRGAIEVAEKRAVGLHGPLPARKKASAIGIDGRQLLGEQDKLRIRHEEEHYTLRVTSKGRLILNK
jgi:hemin uptake protein HemP